MFKGLTRGMASLMASSEFETCRIRATSYRDTDPPSEKDVVIILSCLAGNDAETRASTAFTTIITKLQTSDSRFKWNYIVKNLILLDRALDEGLFIYDIMQLKIDFIENFSDKDSKDNLLGVDLLVRRYFKYVREKAAFFSKITSLSVPRTEKQKYFKDLKLPELLQEIREMSQLVDCISQIIETGSKGHLKFKLSHHLFLLLMDFLIRIFTSEYLGVVQMLDLVFQSPIELAKECSLIYQDYLKTTEMIIAFSRNHQFIKGFQAVSITDFINPKRDAEVLSSIKLYIQTLEQKGTTEDSTTMDPTKAQEIQKKMLEFGGKKLSANFGERPPEFSSKDYFDQNHSPGYMSQSIPNKLNVGLVSAGLVRNSSPAKFAEENNTNTTTQLGRATSEPNQAVSEELPEVDKERDGIYFASKFEMFINPEDKDEQFAIWENFYNDKYSSHYLEGIAWDHSPLRKSRTSNNYDFPEHPVKVLEANKRVFKGGSSFQELLAYDDEIFDNYPNYYSRNYDSRSKKNFISKQAGNIISFFK